MRPLLLVWTLLVLFVVLSAVQGLTPSIFWKNPNITSSKDERIAIASAALEKADSRLQSNGQFNDSVHDTFARFYGQMAEFDRLTNQTRYKESLKQCFIMQEAGTPLFPNYALNYGYAAARAYTAYQDSDFLDLAVTAWTAAKPATISKEQAASGTVDGKEFNLSLSCQGTTLAGGTYSSTYLLDPNLSGLAILASITHNTSTEALTVVAVATDTLWQGLDGIIGTIDIGGHHIVQALAALYERNTMSSDLREYIKEYIGVQYNAVIKKATSGGSNIYGLPWTGPPGTLFSSFNQTIAVTALLSAIQLEDNKPLSKSSDSPTSTHTPIAKMTTSPLPPNKNAMGAIIGGVMGGLAVVVVTIVCFLLCHRQYLQRNHSPLVVDESTPQTLTPFMATLVPVEISQEHHINRAKNARYPVDASRGQPSMSVGAVETDTTGMDVQIESRTPLRAARREDMPTEELLRLLNQRLLLDSNLKALVVKNNWTLGQ
ncbi:hypothetical protein EDD85DRAFT_791000 [Armillaria nabsnona]|nr:hypothetical protein EDD85DRAFT_791000 [Armillaria nabsnona]